MVLWCCGDASALAGGSSDRVVLGAGISVWWGERGSEGKGLVWCGALVCAGRCEEPALAQRLAR